MIHSYLVLTSLILVGIFHVAREDSLLSPVAQQLCSNRRHSRAQTLNPTSGWRFEGLSFVW